ncbi:MAG: tetratricopeptide repeat protein [Chthoniobacterales bacterium]
MTALGAFSLAHAGATGGDGLDTPAVTVGESLDFLPGKSLGEIFLETGAKPADDDSSDLRDEILKISERLRSASPAQLLPSVDDLLVRARQHYSGGDWCNLLHDVRDVLAGSSDDRGAAAEYIKWRGENKDLFFANADGEVSQARASPPSTEIDLEQRAAETSGPLKAHWLYLCGAQTYRTGDREKCRKWFQRVVKEFPNHPRAEIALFMDARCAFSATRKGVSQDEESPPDAERVSAQKRATDLFERYRKQYPRGRFVADALGWLGALAFDAEKYLDALDCYIAQAKTPGHPETLKSAIFMCERSLAAVAAKPEGDAAFTLIARHPRIAMGFTYLVLSAREADNYDGKFDTPADVKKWRRTILPRIAAAVARQKQLYKSGDWQPRYLALLAQSASASGNQTQALQLTNLAPAELEGSDDLLLVRAIALERAGQPADAIATYRKLLAEFPDAPIMPGVRLHLAFALQDNHEAGGALVELMHLMPNRGDKESSTGVESNENSDGAAEGTYTGALEFPASTADWSLRESAVYPNITGANLEQVQEAIDTLLNFAPLTELATALDNAEFDAAGKKELRAIIAERYLAQENFTGAKKFMSPEQFKLGADKLERLTAAVTGSGPEKAAGMAQLGDAWAEARGKLLRAPLDARVRMIEQSSLLNATTRRLNGRSLQLKEVDNELEQRDELRHAARWWMAAARARPGTPLAAQTRWKALESMPRIARESDYAEERAREIKGEAVSRQIYAKLLQECPDSVEAKRLAAYWSFPPPPKPDEEQFDDGFKLRDAHIMGYPFHDFGGFGLAANEQSSEEAGIDSEVRKRVALLPEKAELAEPAQFATEVRQLDAAARSRLTSISDATLINFLDDLAQFSSGPNLTREMLKTYVPIRFMVLQSNGWEQPGPEEPATTKDDQIRAKIDAALRTPEMQAVADYLEFSRIGLLSGDRTEMETDIIDPKGDGAHVSLKTRNYTEMAKLARDFLKKYPRSRKREAALFVLARSVQALSRPYLCEIGVPAPGTTPEEGVFDVVQKSYQPEPFKPEPVLAALDDYDREYPNGRYAAEVRNLRGVTLWRIHDWGKALDLTMAQLQDDSKQDLQPEASVRLANIFADLEQAEYRADLLEAIRVRPAAIKYLRPFLERASKDRKHPLRYLQAYLGDQLNLKAVAQN